jgi:hypothetical protein
MYEKREAMLREGPTDLPRHGQVLLRGGLVLSAPRGRTDSGNVGD